MTLGSRIFVGAIVVLFLMTFTGVILLWKRPLEIYAWYQRRALPKAGLQRVSVDTPFGRQVAWRGGSGPVLVLLHGAGDRASTWASVVPALAGRYSLIVPDLPGHGESAPAAGPLPLGAVFRATQALLEQTATEGPAIVVGNSLGAWIGMLLALDKPAHVARLILVNGGGSTGERPDLTLTPANRDEARKLVNAVRDPGSTFIPNFILDDIIRQAKAGPIGRLSAGAGDMRQYLLDERLPEIRTPADLLWGESDRLLSVEYAKRMLEKLPAARLTLIPRCGHVPQQECPERFTSSLLQVLSRKPPNGNR